MKANILCLTVALATWAFVASGAPRNMADKRNMPLTRFNVPGKHIALTFDDGPNPDVAPELLAILAKHKVKATFFLIGKKIQKNPGLIAKYLEGGHELGNHSMTHPKLPTLNSDEIEEEIAGNQKLIESISGKRPTAFRAPFLKIDDRVWNALEANHLDAYNAAAYLDCKKKDELKGHAKVAAAKVRPGMVILMHERPITLKFLDELLSILEKEGFEFVTVSELKKMATREK